jgi:hypothetical protein
MSHRLLVSAAAVPAALIVFFAQTPAAGQTAPAATKTANSAKAWTPPHTPDGHPDLQGFWTNNTVTPLERPKGLGAKEFYTEAELTELMKTEKNRVALNEEEGRPTEPGTDADVHYDFSQFGLDRGQTKLSWNRRTSLDGPENRPLSARCLVLGQESVPMLPGGYNNNMQIVQGAGYVATLHEMNHSVRIIPTDGRPHAASEIRQWRGDSRGHWEGNTLVVDVTNFEARNPFRGSGEKLHVVERFTPVDADTILYRFTVEDPETWDKPWTAEIAMSRVDGPILEFACHEGNYGLRNTLNGARVAEQDAAAEKAAAAKKAGK